MIVAGLGFRRGATCRDIEDAIAIAVRTHGIVQADITLLATDRDKAAEPAMIEVAATLARPLIGLPLPELAAVSGQVLTHSDKVLQIKGVPALAEAAALVAALAAAGPNARLLGPRSATSRATCALASGDGRTGNSAQGGSE